MNRYMHTINGKPAFFYGDHIYQAVDGMTMEELTVPKLSVIRSQQTRTASYRRKNNLSGHRCVYGYLRIKMETTK